MKGGQRSKVEAMVLLLIILAVVAVAVVLWLVASKKPKTPQDSARSAAASPPVAAPPAPRPAVPPAVPGQRTVLVADPDEAIRQEVDPRALAAARASVSRDVPDEVLSDALQDASPTQLAHLFAAVPEDVMAAAIGAGNKKTQEQARPEDLAQLRGAGEAVNDLEIWDFGKN